MMAFLTNKKTRRVPDAVDISDEELTDAEIYQRYIMKCRKYGITPPDLQAMIDAYAPKKPSKKDSE